MTAGMDSLGWDPRYAGWFHCFNRGLYFEAHDVLEDLWLEGGKAHPNYSFHKGLIQLAGAFVHLQKGRPGPAIALFRLAEANLSRYPAGHDGVDLEGALGWMVSWRMATEAGSAIPLGGRAAPCVTLAPRNAKRA